MHLFTVFVPKSKWHIQIDQDLNNIPEQTIFLISKYIPCTCINKWFRLYYRVMWLLINLLAVKKWHTKKHTKTFKANIIHISSCQCCVCACNEGRAPQSIHGHGVFPWHSPTVFPQYATPLWPYTCPAFHTGSGPIMGCSSCSSDL